MLILGLTKTTLLDYPQKIACTIFTGGCNLSCPYCHNAAFISPSAELEKISESEIFSFLKKRRHQLQGVCISGGEPTLHVDLPDFIRRVKELGYLIKLDTNGTNAAVLKELVAQNLLDYIAMDIKLPIEEYAVLMSGSSYPVSEIQSNLEQSIDFIMRSHLDYEFRTTVAKGLHNIDSVERIAQQIKGAKAYYLQNYDPQEGCGYRPFENCELNELKKIAQKWITTDIR